MKKVMVFGTFDILHPGHTHMLKEAKEYGDYFVVVVSRDETVCQLKGKPPKNSENLRLKQVEALGIADKVRLGCLDDKHQAVKEEDPDIVAIGYDQKFFLDDLEKSLKSSAQIVRLTPFKPEIYKSSKLRHD